MSKSDRDPLSRIVISDSADVIREKLRKAVTDSSGSRWVTYDPIDRPGVSNLIDIYAACTGLAPLEICQQCAELNTVQFKDRVADVVADKLAPIRAKYLELTADSTHLLNIVTNGNQQARTIAQQTYQETIERLGFI